MIDLLPPDDFGMSPKRLERIRGWLRSHVEAERLAGASVLINKGGQNIYYQTAGYRDLESRKPIEPDTIFRIYSMTKPITTLAAMMLYEEGVFQLDDPIARFLPKFEKMDMLVGGDADNPQLEPARSLITMRQLMTHTSGLTYDFFKTSAVDALYRENGITFSSAKGSLADMVRRLAEQPLLFHPGDRWNYGFSTDVLGRVIEVMSGMPLDCFFKERIFEPLGMTDTAFRVDDARVDRFAANYTSDSRPLPPAIGPEPTELPPEQTGGLKLFDPAAGGSFTTPGNLPSGGGGLTSTTLDYLLFCRMLRNGGVLDGQRLIGRKTLDYMRTNHLPGTMADMGVPRFNNAHMGAGLGFGLGFAVILDPVRSQTMGSTGEYFWTGMANTQFWMDPVEDLFVIQMAQLVPSAYVPLRRELRTFVYQALVD